MAQRKRAAAKTTGAARKSPATSRRRRKTRRGARSSSILNGGYVAVRKGVSGDVSRMQEEIRHLATDLQDRLNRLNAISQQGASHASSGLQDFISDTLDRFTSNAMSDLTTRMQDGASDLTHEASRVGGRALKRVSRQIDKRPLLTLAIAAGIGFLAGMARRD